MVIKDINGLILYLYDIEEYVDKILMYHNESSIELDLKEILMYLSSVKEIIKNVISFINENYFDYGGDW